MALRPPDAPSLHFKEREGFITAADVEEDAVEEETPAEEEYVEEEEGAEEEFFEEEEGAEEEFFEEEPSDEEFFEEEAVEEEPVEEETVEEEAAPSTEKKQSAQQTQQTQPAQSAQSMRPSVDRKETSVTIKPPDTGGREGSALPSPQEMASYAQPEDRGQAIIRHFEEEDRRMSEQMYAQTVEEPDDSSIFNFHVEPPGGGSKWLFLIAALTILGYTVVRQLAMDPLKPSKKRREELTVGNTIKKPSATQPAVKPPTIEKPRNTQKASKEELIARALKEVRAASDQKEVKQSPPPRPVKRPTVEVKSAYAIEEQKKTPRPRPAPKPDPSKDEVKHIEIRV